MARERSVPSPEAKAAGGNAAAGRWLALAAIVVLADQATKWAIVRAYVPGEGSFVTGFLNIVRVHNTGAAFSFLAGPGGWQRWFFITLALAVSAFIIRMIRRHAHEKALAAALALILGGALGNAMDRALRGYVVDFLDFHWPFLAGLFAGGHYPAFNVADAAITVGAVSLILAEFLRRKS